MSTRTVARVRASIGRVRPLQARLGARFACHGDGLCCTDAHVLGPVARGEARSIGLVPEEAIVYHATIGAHALVTRGGRCHLLVVSGDDSTESTWRCALHDDRRPFAKPDGCRRFPFGLVATPRGGRITTAHRCPCRTMGAAREIDLTEAERSLVDRRRRLRADLRVGERVRIAKNRAISFDRYCELEGSLLERISSSEQPIDALDSAPLPQLRDLRWSDVAHLLRSRIDGSACGDALAWAGDTLLFLCGEGRRPIRRRAWTPAFDRAERRTPPGGNSRDLLADWLCDEIWSLGWTYRSNLSVARAEIATRAAIASDIAAVLTRAGARPDRAMAEGILVAELTGESPIWRGVVHAAR